jgi:hypothetical protein
VSFRTCPDWPALMEVAPDLQFRHHTLGEMQLPHDVFVRIGGISLDEVAVCCDVNAHVYNPEHTDPRIVEALHGTFWIDVRELGAPPAAA